MTIRTLFVTRLYEAMIDNSGLLDELDHSVRMLAEEDRAGRAWSKAHGYRGYTSYASLNDLPVRDPVFADLVRLLNGHVRRFAEASHLDIGRKLKLDSLWVNLIKPGGSHSGHIHPHSSVSGTFYVGIGRAEARGPAAAADDGGADAQARRARGQPQLRHCRAAGRDGAAVGELAAP